MRKQSIAEIPPEAADADKWALRLISMSSSRDFRDGEEWGKWCRSVAGAGLAKDDKKLAWLEREMCGHANAPHEPRGAKNQDV